MKNDVMYFIISGRLKVAEEVLQDLKDQLSRKKQTFFDDEYLNRRISELIIEIRIYRELLACTL